ncbi:hypothetical protein BDP27DRAFT_1372699 [Rhodocollybia butyracea]|uniref:Uncharacterized protein n=1 Tax=Rhodocollybia butyracea TaxID=206335 RepID=A0A9P5TWG3_9AGAR|nr:hypothetical protein BDP27DRAFT_1372699 [Rhodocollybia butyracea]
MGKALVSSPPRGSMMKVICTILKADEDCMGVWVNGMKEKTATWLGELGIPLFVVHKIRTKVDQPKDHPNILRASHPIRHCDIKFARFPRLINDHQETNNEAGERWNVRIDSQEAQPKDQLLHWRSFSGANADNFPGEQWSMSRISENPAGENSRAIVHPPPVEQVSQQGSWVNFAMSNDDSSLKFYLVGKKNKDTLDDFKKRYYDQKEIPIPKEVAFNTFIYRLPLENAHFYNGRDMKQEMNSSIWVYRKKDHTASDLLHSNKPPQKERITSSNHHSSPSPSTLKPFTMSDLPAKPKTPIMSDFDTSGIPMDINAINGAPLQTQATVAATTIAGNPLIQTLLSKARI